MKKKIFDRRGAGIELAILMMVVSFSMSILLTSVALIQSTKKVRAEERLQQSIALEQLGQDFLSAVLSGTVEDWLRELNKDNNYTCKSESAAAHNWGDWTVETPATCTKDGLKSRVCNDCNEPDKHKETIPALGGHSCSQIVVEKDDNDEVIKKSCGECQEELLEDAPIVHNWGEWQVEILETCTTAGLKTRSCLDCEKPDEPQIIPALGHNCSKIETITETDSETNEKIVKRICKECQTEIGETEATEIVHNLIRTEQKKATCTEKGSVTITCSCGATQLPDEEVPFAEHNWNNEGKCADCGEKKPAEYYDAYELIVYKNGDSFDVYVTITASNSEVCDPENANLEPAANGGDAETAEPAGKQVLTICVVKVTDADGSFTYKITEWTKNDRS